MYLSVVVPVYNEYENIPLLYDEVVEALKDIQDWELIMVNDGSQDNSLEALKELAEISLRMVPFGTPEYPEAKRLLSFLEWVKPLDRSLIPDNSILAEFVGGSNLKDFISWRS